jgi:hypothetical protein
MKFVCPECEGFGDMAGYSYWSPPEGCWACTTGELSFFRRFVWLPWVKRVENNWPEKLWPLYPLCWRGYILRLWMNEDAKEQSP